MDFAKLAMFAFMLIGAAFGQVGLTFVYPLLAKLSRWLLHCYMSCCVHR